MWMYVLYLNSVCISSRILLVGVDFVPVQPTTSCGQIQKMAGHHKVTLHQQKHLISSQGYMASAMDATSVAAVMAAVAEWNSASNATAASTTTWLQLLSLLFFGQSIGWLCRMMYSPFLISRLICQLCSFVKWYRPSFYSCEFWEVSFPVFLS